MKDLDQTPFPAGIWVKAGEGMGKSHLASLLVRASSRVKQIEQTDLERLNDFPDWTSFSGKRLLLLDGLGKELLLDKSGETGLFHLINLVREQVPESVCLLVTSRYSSEELNWSLPDLASRVKRAVLLEIGEPGESELEELMIEFASRRGFALAPEVLAFWSKRMERRLLFAQRLVEAASQQSLARKSPLTLPIAREALEQAYREF